MAASRCNTYTAGATAYAIHTEIEKEDRDVLAQVQRFKLTTRKSDSAKQAV